MPVDPQLTGLLAAINAPDAPRVDTLSVPEARAVVARLGALAGEPEPVDEVAALSVGGGAGPLAARRYRPAGAGDADLPVLVWFHGGGWVVGDLDGADGTCRRLANRAGCVVVSVDYRLAPEAPFPAGVEDAFAAAAWVAGHPGEVGADTTRLAVGGDSAGGNLATVTCLLARDRGGPAIAFQLLVYPSVDQRLGHPSIAENGTGYVLTGRDIRWFLGHYLGDADPTDWRASPLLAPDLSGLPPALVVTAEFDALRDEGEAYAARLREAGVPATESRYDGMVHAFFGMTGLVDAADAAVDEAAAALRAALGEP